MRELSFDQIELVSGGSEESYKAGQEIGEAIGKAVKYAGAIMLFYAALSS